MNSNGTIGYIRCTYCGETYQVNNNLSIDGQYFHCRRCDKDFDVTFFAFCGKCNKTVGLDNSSAINLIIDGAVVLISQPWSALGYLPRIFDSIPSANGWGKCPFCDTTYFRCPRCSSPVEVKNKLGLNDTIRCQSCGQTMRHP